MSEMFGAWIELIAYRTWLVGNHRTISMCVKCIGEFDGSLSGPNLFVN